MGRKSKQRVTDLDWDTPGGRVRWLLVNLWDGNRLALAQDVGVSHAVVNKVAARMQEPGRRLLAAIADHPKVNPAWLLTGQGTPLLQAADVESAPRAVPVARQLLPGSPQQYAAQLSEDAFDHRHLFLGSQYWLRLQPGQPILEDPERGFLLGDFLLMETDRRRFPRERWLHGRLCVVWVPGEAGQEPTLRLGAVTFYPAAPDDPPRLEVDPFDLGLPRDKLVKRVTVDRYPGGKYRVREEELELTTFRGQERAVERGASNYAPKPEIVYGGVVAVWTQILHRPGGMMVE